MADRSGTADARWRPLTLSVAALAIACTLSACETWFGQSSKTPLPGTRISALEHQRTLAPEPQTLSETVTLPAAATNPDWPQASGYANHAMHHLALGAAAAPVWKADIGHGIASDRPWLPWPVAGDGRIYTMDSEHLVSAFDANSGKRLWQTDLARKEEDDDAIPGGLAFDAGKLFVTTGFSKVFALDATSGKPLWHKFLGLPIHAPPAAGGGRLFVVTVENALYALNADDGSEAWPPHQETGEAARLLGGASPAIETGVVVAPFSSGDLVALRADIGRVLWTDSLASRRRTDELAAIAQIRGAPVIDNGRVYAMSQAGSLVAVDLRSGQRVWDRDVGGLYSPWVAGNYLFLISSDNELVCVRADNGQVVWVTKLEMFKDKEKRKGAIQWAGPVLAGDRLIIVGSNGRLMMLSPYDGKAVASRELPAPVRTPPLVANATLYILGDDGTLTAYR